jgi:hypothetical protein
MTLDTCLILFPEDKKLGTTIPGAVLYGSPVWEKRGEEYPEDLQDINT